MSRQMTATELKAKLLAVLDDVSAGDDVEITKHGRTVARLVPARSAKPERGFLAGTARTVDADDDLLSSDATWEFD